MSSRAPVPSAYRHLRGAVARLGRLRPRDLLAALHVAVVLAVVELLVRWVPLPRLSRLVGVRVDLGPAPAAAEPLASSDLPLRERRQLDWTRRLSDAWPFSRGPCLRRALVGGHLLRRRAPVIRLGVMGSGDDLVGHAWLEIDGRPVDPVAGVTPFRRPSPRAVA